MPARNPTEIIMHRPSPSLRFETTKLSLLGLAVALVLSSVLLACGGTQGSEEASPEDPAPQASTPPAGDSPLPALSSRDGDSAGPVADGAEIVAPGALFNLPAGWASEPPNSTMRLAQASIPGPEEAGQLTVFHFGVGGGGGLESNLQRWAGQVEPDPGTAARRDSFTVGAYNVTWLEVQGTLKPSTMGTGPTSPQPNSILLGGVVEGAGGPWYFKATGPASALAPAREPFLSMLRSVRPAS